MLDLLEFWVSVESLRFLGTPSIAENFEYAKLRCLENIQVLATPDWAPHNMELVLALFLSL